MTPIDPATGEKLSEGLFVETIPCLPRGYRIVCAYCACTVTASHRPGLPECQEDRRERDVSRSS